MSSMMWRLALLGVVVAIANDTVMATLPNCSDIAGELVFPNTTLVIPQEEYRNCLNITSLRFEENSTLTTIGRDAFFNAINLAGNLDIPSTVEMIGNAAFYQTAITGLSFEENSNLTTIGNSVFYNVTTLTGTLTIPSTVEEIGHFAFYKTAITDLSFQPDSNLRTIGTYAFFSVTTLTGNLDIPSKVEAIGDGAFYATAITSVTIPELAKLIGQTVFNYCIHLTRVVMPGDGPFEKYNDGEFDSLSNLVSSLCHDEGNNGTACIEGNGTRAGAIIASDENTCGISCCEGFSCAPPPAATSASTTSRRIIPDTKSTSSTKEKRGIVDALFIVSMILVASVLIHSVYRCST